MTQILAAALVLQLHNFAGAPASIVADTTSEVTRLYADIGVRLQWRDPPSGSDGPDVIRVILLPNETGDLHRTSDTVMGAAVATANRTSVAYVFYRRVRAEADRYGTSTVQVLACAMAHEIGHLLMPQTRHSPDGLMRARWRRDDFSRADQGLLRFSAEQIGLIRAAADERRVQGSGFRVLGSRSCSGSGSGDPVATTPIKNSSPIKNPNENPEP